jgi:hypothetical protein
VTTKVFTEQGVYNMLFFSTQTRRLRRSLFGIPLEATTFAKRGFYRGERAAQDRLESIAATFLQGYHAVLEDDRFEVLIPSLQEIEEERRGFAYEGAAMGFALLDYFLPFKQGLEAFMQGPGANHIYMLHVGAGWTLGRLPRSASKLMQRYDPLLGWLVLDGYGFHQGFFSWPRFVENHLPPARFSGYALKAFDQGLGRSLWFVKGADIEQIAQTIEGFPSQRRSDLWSGVGLASAYAGGIERAELEQLYHLAGKYRWHLAQGTVFAATARHKAENPAAHTDLACVIFTGYSSDEAARLSDLCLEDLPQGEDAYELWRLRLRSRLAEQNERV